MYNNIGKKIKGLAFGIFILEAIASVITGIGLIASDDDLIPIGIIILSSGPFVAYFVSLFVYAFGELVDKTCDVERNTRSGERKSDTQAKVDSERINKLERLRAQGLITEEEYQQAISKKN